MLGWRLKSFKLKGTFFWPVFVWNWMWRVMNLWCYTLQNVSLIDIIIKKHVLKIYIKIYLNNKTIEKVVHWILVCMCSITCGKYKIMTSSFAPTSMLFYIPQCLQWYITFCFCFFLYFRRLKLSLRHQKLAKSVNKKKDVF